MACQRLGGSFALMRPINDKEAIIPINRLFSQWSEVTKGLMNMAKFYFSGGEPKLDKTYENGLYKGKIWLYSVSYCFYGKQMQNHFPEKLT